MIIYLIPDFGVNKLSFGSSVEDMEFHFGVDNRRVVQNDDGTVNYFYDAIDIMFEFCDNRLQGVSCDNPDCDLKGRYPVGENIHVLQKLYNVSDFCVDSEHVIEDESGKYEMWSSSSINCIFGVQNGVVETVTIGVSYDDSLDPIFPV